MKIDKYSNRKNLTSSEYEFEFEFINSVIINEKLKLLNNTVSPNYILLKWRREAASGFSVLTICKKMTARLACLKRVQWHCIDCFF